MPKTKTLTSYYVNFSNELVRAAHGLTLIEKRVLMLAVSKLDTKAKPIPTNLVCRITVQELVREYGLDEKSAYRQAYEAVEHLMDRYIRFKHDDLEVRMQWVGQANYKESEGWLELEFWHKLSPMLFELKNRFTSYQLSRAGGLRSIYSWRLFELLMQFKTTGFLTISINEFNHAMEVTQSLKINFANLRSRVIEPAVKEIKEKDGLAVTWEAIKGGRKVKALKFTFPAETQDTKTPTKRTPSPKPAASETLDKPLIKAQAKAELDSFKKLAALAKLKGVEKVR